MHVTVAICTWNRATLLEQTLEHLTRMSIPAGVTWDLLVVNNNSTDDTECVVARFQTRLPVRCEFEPRPGKSHALNRSLRLATGDYIAWTDDDVLVDRHWIGALVDAAREHPSMAAFGGPIDPWFPITPDPSLLEAFGSLRSGFCGLDYGATERVLVAGEYVWGANMGVARSAVAGIQFRTNLGPSGTSTAAGEDAEFIRQIRERGGDLLWVPAMRVQHYVDPSRMTLDYLLRFSFGKGQETVRTEGIPDGPRLLSVPRHLWRRCAGAYTSYVLNTLSGRKVAALQDLKQYHWYRGMAAECRAQIRGPA